MPLSKFSSQDPNPATMFGPSGPEGLQRCFQLMRTRWRILLPLSLLFFALGIIGLSLESGKRPDLPLLEQRFRLMMTWSLPEAHYTEVRLSGLRQQGDEWLATYRFLVHATEGAEESSTLKARLEARFPECGELLFQTGKACTAEEKVRFIPIPEKGLVPDRLVNDYPELLSQL